MKNCFKDLSQSNCKRKVPKSRAPNVLCFLSFILTDLQLAAELGKALLERNRDLESQLIHAQQIDADQQLEIEVNRAQKATPYAK